ncbi:hypothetical protein OB13_13630 [Pontibacter sp. HJ8]
MKKHNQELEIDEDSAFAKSTWTAERVAWVLIGVLLLAVLLGFTGNGGVTGINKRTAGSQATGIAVEYDRYLRREAPSEIKVILSGTSSEATKELQFNQDFYDQVHVEQVIPEPTEVSTHENGITYKFAGTAPIMPIIFYLQPKHMGTHEIHVQAGKSSVSFSQFVYP